MVLRHTAAGNRAEVMEEIIGTLRAADKRIGSPAG
jgi:hypothetical protein